MTPVCDITIQLSAKVLTTKRANTKLIEVLGDVGGLMEVVWSAFNILSIFITDLLYDIDIVNSLFSFDLSKKTVKIKKDSKDNYDLSDVDEINIYNAKKSKNTHTIKFSAQIKEKEENTETPAVEQIKTKKKKKIKSKRTIASSNNANDEKNSYNHNMNFNINENKKVNEVEKQTIMSNNLMASHENLNELKKTVEAKNSEIFEEIKINKFFIVFAFCCIRKRKNINNYVLVEGLNLIGKRLDVFNIFKRLYYDEKVQRSYMIGEEEFAMSEECKEKLS